MGFYRVLPSSSRIFLLSFRDCGSGTGEEPFLFCLMMGWDDIQRWFFFFCQKGITGFFCFACSLRLTATEGRTSTKKVRRFWWHSIEAFAYQSRWIELMYAPWRALQTRRMKRKRKKKCKEKGKDRARRRQGRFFIGISLFRPPFYFFASRAIPFSCSSSSSSRGQVAATSMARSLLVAKK